MRARVIERASGAVVGEIEAATSYGLWEALLSWGEQRGVPRFRVPERYRSERAPASGPPAAVDEAAVTPPPPSPDVLTDTIDPSPPVAAQPTSRPRANRRARPVVEPPRASDEPAAPPALPSPTRPAAPVAQDEAPPPPAALLLTTSDPAQPPPRPTRKRRQAAGVDAPTPRPRPTRAPPDTTPPIEQLRLF